MLSISVEREEKQKNHSMFYRDLNSDRRIQSPELKSLLSLQPPNFEENWSKDNSSISYVLSG